MSASLRRRTESTNNILDNDENIWIQRQERANKWVIRSFVMLVVLIIMLVIALGVENYLLKEHKKLSAEELHPDSTNDGVCVPCDFLGPEVTTNDTLYDVIKMTKAGRVCCYRKYRYLHKLIFRMMHFTVTDHAIDFDHEVYEKLRWWRNRRSAIHMYLDLDLVHKTTDVIKWTDQHDNLGTAFQNGIRYKPRDGTFEIIESGIYFVYSAITFDFGDMTYVDIHTHKVHKMHRLTPTTTSLLLLDKFGGSSETKRTYTSLVCGSFNFDSGLLLKSEISGKTALHVMKSKYASFFGIFKI